MPAAAPESPEAPRTSAMMEMLGTALGGSASSMARVAPVRHAREGGNGQAQEATPAAAWLGEDPCAAVEQGSVPAMMTPGPMWPDMMTPGAMGPGMMMGDPELMALDMLRYHAAVDAAIAQVAVARAEQPELRGLAEEVLRARQAETDHLNRWREQWYPDRPELPMGPMMGMLMGPMMGAMMQGTPGRGCRPRPLSLRCCP